MSFYDDRVSCDALPRDWFLTICVGLQILFCHLYVAFYISNSISYSLKCCHRVLYNLHRMSNFKVSTVFSFNRSTYFWLKCIWVLYSSVLAGCFYWLLGCVAIWRVILRKNVDITERVNKQQKSMIGKYLLPLQMRVTDFLIFINIYLCIMHCALHKVFIQVRKV